MKKLLLFLTATLTLTSLSDTSTIEEPLRFGPAELVCHTPDPEITSAKIALISVHPKLNETIRHTNVLKGHISAGHWSALEHEYMTIKINCSRAISLQLIRHRSFTFQQFSQKYANTELTIDETLPMPDFRTYGRPMDKAKKEEFELRTEAMFKESLALYKDLIAAKVKRECARFVLPEITPTIVCMTGNIRSWIHFIERCSRNDSQDEMHDIVNGCKEIFKVVYPNISRHLSHVRKHLGW